MYFGRIVNGMIHGEMSVNISDTKNSVTITGLVSGAEYQFQVAVMAMFQGQQLMGRRSALKSVSIVPLHISEGIFLTNLTCTINPYYNTFRYNRAYTWWHIGDNYSCCSDYCSDVGNVNGVPA